MDNKIDQSLDGNWKLLVIRQNNFEKMAFSGAYDEVINAGSRNNGGRDGDGCWLIDAAVPGNFEIDLERAGIIPDPFYANNALLMSEWEDCHVIYAKKFNYKTAPGIIHEGAASGSASSGGPASGSTIPELVFEGIDTIADIYLNGRFLAHTENMFVTHRINAGGLVNGENSLVIHILPCVLEARKNKVSAGNKHQKYNYECLRLRKAPSMFGWDITPRLVSAGIYRSAGIYLRPPESFKQCYLMTVSTDPHRRTVKAELFYEIDIGNNRACDYTVSISGKCGESEFLQSSKVWFTAGKIRFDIQNAFLWQPKNYGRPNLYDIEIRLLKNGKAVDSYKTKTGFRTVKLVRTGTTDTLHSGAFHFLVNGQKVFIMGTNWVPADSFHSRDRERIPQIMKLLDDIGCNAVRCWGGNIYEDPLFYQKCDEMGIMVWQDFAMACGIYPTDDEFKKVMFDEAVSVIRQLRQHPSIILWSGDNECDQGHKHDGFGRDPNLNRITREVLPDAVYNEDPARPYLPSSPFVDTDAWKLEHGNLAENHLWGPRDYFKSDFYKNSLCHFASEIGYHGSVSLKSMRRFLSPQKIWPWKDSQTGAVNDEWIVHAASPETSAEGNYVYRIELMASQIGELFSAIPQECSDFVLASQISQAEAKKFFVELFRTQPHRSGIIWWNLIDCWPQFSDAVADYFYNKKLAFNFLRQSQKPLLLTFTEPKNWKLTLTASNLSGAGNLEFSYKVKDFESGDIVLCGKSSCPDQGIFEIDSVPYSQGEKKIYLIEWECTDAAYSGANHYLAGNPPFELSIYRDFLKKEYGSIYNEIFE
ncbi:MAG: hypothetical protein FWD78_06785 [Treponema sp.]|nr:hypothetical protein [Treponema sp.]